MSVRIQSSQDSQLLLEMQNKSPTSGSCLAVSHEVKHVPFQWNKLHSLFVYPKEISDTGDRAAVLSARSCSQQWGSPRFFLLVLGWISWGIRPLPCALRFKDGEYSDRGIIFFGIKALQSRFEHFILRTCLPASAYIPSSLQSVFSRLSDILRPRTGVRDVLAENPSGR